MSVILVVILLKVTRQELGIISVWTFV